MEEANLMRMDVCLVGSVTGIFMSITTVMLKIHVSFKDNLRVPDLCISLSLNNNKKAMLRGL